MVRGEFSDAAVARGTFQTVRVILEPLVQEDHLSVVFYEQDSHCGLMCDVSPPPSPTLLQFGDPRDAFM